jgi:flagellar motor protein MotB
MSMTRGSFLAAPVLALVAQACVPKQTYEMHVSELNETIAQRDAEISNLRGVKGENDRLRAENELLKVHRDAYDQLSHDIREALDGLKGEGIVQNKETGAWTMESDLLFRSGSWDVSAEGRRVLKKFADACKNKEVKLRIVGHTDVDPIKLTKKEIPSETNLELGFRRSLAVMEALLKNGVKESRMFIESKGMNEPIVRPETTPAAKKKNRRVEIYVFNTTPAETGSK